jgi:TolB protein
MLAWSPDGSRIAFKGSNPPPAAGGCVSTIYVVNADGSGRTNLTNGPADAGHGGWSPDGTRFAFTSDRDGNAEIYVVNADGSALTNVTNDPGFNNFSDNPGNDGSAWSPDSSRLSFIAQCKVVGGKLELYVVNADGSGLTYVGHPDPDVIGGWMGCDASFDPNGPPISGGYDPNAAHVAFVKGFGDGKGEELFVMNADGSGLTRLTNNAVDDHNLVWSPDMSRIAWGRSIAGNAEIWVVNPDGSGLTRLSNGPEGDALRDGGWAPDSSRIAFGSSRDGNEEIYLVNADGSGLTNLTNNPGEDNGPVWSPAR